MSKKGVLENFFNEIQVLTRCNHPNIVKILDASFNGTLIKEALPVRNTSVENTLID